MRTTWIASALVTTLCAGGAAAQAFDDDGETGTVVDTDTPPGRWDYQQTASGSSVTNVSQAAHRGARGIRVQDGSTGSSPNSQAYASVSLSAPATSQYHLRFWVRVTTSNSSGDVFVGSIRGATQDLLNFHLRPQDGHLLAVGGFDDNGGWSGDVALSNSSLTVGAWHLAELSVRGLGSQNGSRQVFVDGALIYEEQGIDWSSWDARRLMLGVFWSEDLSFLGQLDYDDIRGATTEHASTLALGVPATASVGACVPISVSLKASNGMARSAPYAFTAPLAVAGATGSFFSDPACTTSAPGAAFAAGVSMASAYFKPASTGAGTITASFVDLLPATSPIQLTPEVMTDAGVADAGTDAGTGGDGGSTSDGGSGGDAGVKPDGGASTGPVARVTPAEQTVAAGTIVTLDSAASTAPGGLVKQRLWSLVQGPAWVELAGDREISLKPEVPGTYVVELVVTDALDVRSAPERARIIVEGDVYHPPESLGGCGCGAGGAGSLGLGLFAALVLARLGRRKP